MNHIGGAKRAGEAIPRMNRGGGDLLLEQVLEAVHGLPPLVRAERHGGGGDVGRNIWRLASYRTRSGR